MDKQNCSKQSHLTMSSHSKESASFKVQTTSLKISTYGINPKVLSTSGMQKMALRKHYYKDERVYLSFTETWTKLDNGPKNPENIEFNQDSWQVFNAYKSLVKQCTFKNQERIHEKWPYMETQFILNLRGKHQNLLTSMNI